MWRDRESSTRRVHRSAESCDTYGGDTSKGAGLDDHELARVCAEHHPRLVGLIALQVGDLAVAEELAQDALLALCRRRGSVDRPAAWLTRVALNLANSSLRRRYAERRALRRTHAASRGAVPTTDEAEAVAIRAAVASLPPRQREAVALRFYEGLSVAETAVVMGCAEGTVKAHVHKGMTHLRELFLPSTQEAHDG